MIYVYYVIDAIDQWFHDHIPWLDNIELRCKACMWFQAKYHKFLFPEDFE